MMEERLVSIDFPVEWCTGAPCPNLLQSEYQTFLTFFLHQLDPDWDGTYANVRHPGDPAAGKIAVVEFNRCYAAKMGAPDVDILYGHPLKDKGLVPFSAQEILNSRWIEELQTIYSVHPQYSSSPWNSLHHYIFWFHDSTFECIAESFSVEVQSKSLPDVLRDICDKLVE